MQGVPAKLAESVAGQEAYRQAASKALGKPRLMAYGYEANSLQRSRFHGFAAYLGNSKVHESGDILGLQIPPVSAGRELDATDAKNRGGVKREKHKCLRKSALSKY